MSNARLPGACHCRTFTLAQTAAREVQAQFVTARAPPWDSAAIVVIIDPFGSRGLLALTPSVVKSPRAIVNIGSRVTGAENLAGGKRPLCIDLRDKLTGRPTAAYGAQLTSSESRLSDGFAPKAAPKCRP